MPDDKTILSAYLNRETKEAAQQVLRPRESLSEFVEQALTEKIRRRKRGRNGGDQPQRRSSCSQP